MQNASEKPFLIGIFVILLISAGIIFIPQRPMFVKMTMTAIENAPEAYAQEEIEMLLQSGANTAMFISIFYFVCTPFFKGGVAYALSTILGGEGKFKSTLGVVVNAYFIMLLGQLVRMIIVLMTKDPYFSFSAALLLGSGSEMSSLFSVLSAIDIFSLWYLGVSMIGIQKLHNLSTVKAFAAVFGPWLMVIAFGFAGAM
jgi:hypothetical protein